MYSTHSETRSGGDAGGKYYDMANLSITACKVDNI